MDLDATDDPLHGHQEDRLFHGYFDCYCYLPLYMFCGDKLLLAKLKTANLDPGHESLPDVVRVIGQIRRHWPKVRIILRGDSGFCREDLMHWCEENDVLYVFGIARNNRLLIDKNDIPRSVYIEPLESGVGGHLGDLETERLSVGPAVLISRGQDGQHSGIVPHIDRKTYNPRWAGKSSNVVTIWRSRQLCSSSSAALSKSPDSYPSWLMRRALKTRNLALWKAEERVGDIPIPRSRQGDRVGITRSLDLTLEELGRPSPDAAGFS